MEDQGDDVDAHSIDSDQNRNELAEKMVWDFYDLKEIMVVKVGLRYKLCGIFVQNIASRNQLT